MKSILIVDDEKHIREIYKRLMDAWEDLKFKVFEASNALDATECIIKEEIDLILLDIRLPMINGQQLYQAIRKYKPGIKIMVSSVYPVEHQKKIIPFADDYYDKSEGPRGLLEKVSGLFSDEQRSWVTET